MSEKLRNILAVVSGIIGGSIINMGIIMVSGSIIPPPPGADTQSMEGLKASMHLFGPEHFLFPFLAHALGTLAGAYIAIRISTSKNLKLAMVIGAIFFVGGATNIFTLPSPLWFSLCDIILAYFPMAYLGAVWGGYKKIKG